MTAVIDPAAVRHGRAYSRYFRENYAQGGLDLVQVVPELVTNADAAIAAGGRPSGSIYVRFGRPELEFVRHWRRSLRALGTPAILDWRAEVSCTDDGEGVDATTVDRRLGALGVVPERVGQRGLFGRGLRDVWLAQGGGRIQGIRDARAVESWFFPARGDEPYEFAHVVDEPVTPATRRAFGIGREGTRVTVPLTGRLPPNWRLRDLVTNLVQLRPILEDASRELWLELEGEPLQLVSYARPEPDPDRPVLLEEEVALGRGISARVVVRRAAAPIPLVPSRATRRGGLVIRSGRAAHETTLVGFESRPGARHLFGEVWCEALESLQRNALESPRPELVVKVDRSGLNENHAVVQRLYAAIARILRPIVDEEERRAGAHVIRAGRAIQERDEVGLRALNDALRAAFDAPGSAGFGRGTSESDEAAREAPARAGAAAGISTSSVSPQEPASAMRFKQSPLRMHPGEQRTVSLLFDPVRIPAGTPIEVLEDPGLRLALRSLAVPEPGRGDWSRVSGALRARATVEPGTELSVLAQAGPHAAELEVVIVRHRAGGWVREIKRKDEESVIEADFEPETGVVTVYEGRREFKALERAARRAGLTKARLREYLPYRMLEVEVAANAVYQWAAERIVQRRLVGERPAELSEYATAVHHEAQRLRHDHHGRLMRAFLEPEVFEGGVQVERVKARDPRQASLLDG